MTTLELLIVFAALMAVVALVGIAIDWVGRPLRHRRFIPRIYRYEDELTPDGRYLAAYDASAAVPQPAGPSMPAPFMPGPTYSAQPAGTVPRPTPNLVPSGTRNALPPAAAAAGAMASATATSGRADTSTGLAPPFEQPRSEPGMADQSIESSQPTPEPHVEAVVAQTEVEPQPQSPPTDGAAPSVFADAAGVSDGSHLAESSRKAPRGVAQTIPIAAAPSWDPGMALDARAGDREPTVEVKAERFWIEAAFRLGDEHHFTQTDIELMETGRSPRRRNPRTGDTETMELFGLRSAASFDDVRMRWPGEAVDPWSPS